MSRAATDGTFPSGPDRPGGRASAAAGGARATGTDVGPDDVVDRALAILEHDSRDWVERQKRLYPPAAEGVEADREL